MGFDLEYLLDAEGEDIAEAYEDAVYEANEYFKNHYTPTQEPVQD